MRYLHYDVFTDRKFEGNQLAVFHDARGLTKDQMQAITKEMNFSECTFILPPEKAGTDVRMRIFMGTIPLLNTKLCMMEDSDKLCISHRPKGP